MRNTLLLWIVQPDELDEAVTKIKEIWKPSGFIYIMQRRFELPIENFYIVWNTEYDFRYPNVLKINRKGTTYFTIDALNLLSIQNSGKIDRDFTPNWEDYKYSILLSNKEGELNWIKTVTYDTVKI
jgi:hypothetical protein